MYANLADLKTHLNIPASKSRDDLELQLMLNAAAEVVTGIIGPVGAGDVVETLPVHGGTVLLNHVPATSVVVRSSAGTVLSGYTVRPAARLLTGVASSGDVTVSYDGSSGFVPYAVQLATLIIAGHLWETQRGTSPSQLALQQTDLGESGAVFGRGYAVPDRARQLLEAFTPSTGQIA